jgi:hypothetical protein
MCNICVICTICVTKFKICLFFISLWISFFISILLPQNVLIHESNNNNTNNTNNTQYLVRKYPSYAGVKLPYKRRDEGFGSLGAFTKGMSPLSPALMDVQTDDISDKYMMWPLAYTKPGDDKEASVPEDAEEKAGDGQWRTIKVVNVPSKVVAVREFSGE